MIHLGQVGEGEEGEGYDSFGDVVGDRLSAGRICRGVGYTELSVSSVSVSPDVGAIVGLSVVGFSVGRRVVGIGVGSLVGKLVFDGEADGSRFIDGGYEIVGDGVTGLREGEIVGVSVVGKSVGEEVIMMGNVGESVGISEGAFVGAAYTHPSEWSEPSMTPSPLVSRQMYPGPYLSVQSRSSSSGKHCGSLDVHTHERRHT
mmetsp:Transcript_33158/g.56324  ORF Transcript_33158/g.56324 Transcript_33158/m.56324 type:complete len:202 (-) Transcript_33158:249-854(-)